jgi:murein L,D-transpeptidase YcbB/YkuD
MLQSNRPTRRLRLILLLSVWGALVVPFALPAGASGALDAFGKSVAAATAQLDTPNAVAIANFYAARSYAPFWTGPDANAHLTALMGALEGAAAHGLPTARYSAESLRAAAQAARSIGDMGRLDVALTQAFLAYGRDISSGALTPSQVDSGILVEITRPDPAAMLAAMAGTADPAGYLRALMPQNPAYTKLMAEKAVLEAALAHGAWGGAITAGKLAQGQAGEQVVLLRNRLIDLGYLPQNASAIYDGTMTRAVQNFQRSHGLNADGVAGASTLELLNAAPEQRLASVIVALERLRWRGNTPMGARHIWVNMPDFTAKIVDDGAITYRTRVVIGKNVPDQRSPEFSDMMQYMAVNPSWGVPRSIIVKEYLPLLQANPNAVAHFQVLDNKGRVVPRSSINFANYTSRTFPFGLRQPPSDGNALGLVKFMFPNVHNIYLHDTPAKNLFDNEVRAYSHGCIRVGDPMEMAYVLLGAQSDDPQGVFKTALDSGRETNISLQAHVPVHLVYFTAYPYSFGEVSYRADVYGRDAKLYEALQEAGLEMPFKSG